ncbi:KpsF/GutQ family sugar-phosphate isomerase [Paraglaciecola chathamensis]|uniref:KpsF/GutQ family sugar-phosphate isomerase n=1 Tax=Paraglaciecola chathamensis TaxID=368405 RepID=UPI0026F8927B|nr:KpsF/GutQ family sugar-phosphate isomerase [Paraglaciecola chathamensis]MDO6559656.1 KpsF/GutQ family sugar-phosphate isomerase [Paraglaciecola chathamensis]
MSILSIARTVISTEIQGLEHMSRRLGSDFESAINNILQTRGRTIISGIGKSGIIGKKISASFASTGTPSFFMHPAEAFHGDLGMVAREDVFIAISNSGESEELLKLLPFLNDNGNFIIAMTGNISSTLARNSHCHLDINVPKEACPLQLAPTTSTTAALVMGDALTVALMEKRDFRAENFARFHPGGNLGKRLLSRVGDAMIKRNIPCVNYDAPFSEILHSISISKLGLTLVDLNAGKLGIITDGDIRRAMDEKGKESFDLISASIATTNPHSISPEMTVQQAYEIMELESVSSLLVLKNGEFLGVLKK